MTAILAVRATTRIQISSRASGTAKGWFFASPRKRSARLDIAKLGGDNL